MKKCNKCFLEKELTEFHKCKTEKDGYRHSCKECRPGYKPHVKPTIEKQCLDCKIVKPINKFSFTNKEKSFRNSDCMKCKAKKQHLKRMLNPDKELLRKRKIDLRTKYNMTIEEYNQMYLDQGGKCKVCPREVKRTLHLDHCHKTGIVRGLLCEACNHTLGFAQDNIQILQGLINYLQMTKTFKTS